MRSVVAAASLLALAVVLFSDGRSLFTTPLHASAMTNGQVYSRPVTPYVGDATYAMPGYASSQPDTAGWSQLAMFAVVGTIAGAAIGSTMKGRNQEMVAPLAALAVSGKPVPENVLDPENTLPFFPRTGPTPELQELKELAVQLNPAVGYFDPLQLSEREFWGQSNAATIGFLRHSEIKHGRVAMAGFVGFLVHANGIHFPWKIPGDELCAPGVSPVLLWQNMPDEAKLQIIFALGIFEIYSEAAMSKVPAFGGHYMRGGKPGFFPPFRAQRGDNGKNGCFTDEEGNQLLPHSVPLNLWDPFNYATAKKSEEWKAEKLIIELNNGRLAMLGLLSFLAEGAIPGSVPFLDGVIPASGPVNVMMPLDMTKGIFGW